jgi:hypothetical protein
MPQPTGAMLTPYAEVLSTLAILKVQNNHGQDYLQNFIPFVAECLRTADSDVVTLQMLQTKFKSNFGLDIPQGVLKTLLNKAVKQDLVRQEQKVYYRNKDKIDGFSLSNEREKAGRELDTLIQKFISFSKINLQHDISIERAEVILYDFIREYGSEALAPSDKWSEVHLSDQYLAGAFVTYLYKSDAEGFSYLEDAVKGSMLATMLHYHNPSQINQAWEAVQIYFDSPLLLRALGLYGEAIQSPYTELISLLKKQGVKLLCFQRTIDELQRILASVEQRLRTGGSKTLQTFEELGEELLATNYKPADIKLLSAGLENALAAIGIRVRSEPSYQAHLTLQVSKADDVFQSAINYKYPAAKEHDVEAVLAIHRLRHGRKPQEVERCSALFITTNSRVVRATAQVFFEQVAYSKDTVPACMLYDQLTTLVWLKNPLILHDLPRKQIIADALAALKPSSDVWQRYLSEIDSLRRKGDINEEQIIYLRCAPEAVSDLAKLTLNDADAYSEGTVTQVLSNARTALSREANEQLATAQRDSLTQKSHIENIAHTISIAATSLIYALILSTILYATWKISLEKDFPIKSLSDFTTLDSSKLQTLILYLIVAILTLAPLFETARQKANLVTNPIQRWIVTKLSAPGKVK